MTNKELLERFDKANAAANELLTHVEVIYFLAVDERFEKAEKAISLIKEIKDVLK